MFYIDSGAHASIVPKSIGIKVFQFKYIGNERLRVVNAFGNDF